MPPVATEHTAPHRRMLVFARVCIAGVTALLLVMLLLRATRAQEPVPATPSAQDAITGTTAVTISVQPAVASGVTAAITNATTLTQAAALTATPPITDASAAAIRPPTLHVVREGESLFLIAQAYSVTLDALIAANSVLDPNRIDIDQVLFIPGGAGLSAAPAPIPPAEAPLLSPFLTATATSTRTNMVARMTEAGRKASLTSPYYHTTWLTYYGRPQTPVMGILGEYNVISLTALLKEKAQVIDAANGSLKVKPAFHLVHGMATVVPTPENDYLEYLPDDVVKQYIDAGLKENIAVILDIQIGNVSVTEAISPALKFLKYPNVHLAIDPEFAMSQPGQAVPGNPIGYVTGEQINAAQELMAGYLTQNGIRGRRILLVHQFFEEMIVDKEQIDWDNPSVELTFCADGWGDPWGKIWKYNHFFSARDDVKYTAFKLFYRWDEPLLTEREALGVDPYSEQLAIEVAPNMIIYQ